MSKIVHNKTVIQTELLIIDDDGNAIDRKIATLEIYKLLPDEFAEAYRQIVAAKDNLEEQCQVQSE